MEDKRKKRRLKQIIIGLLIFFALGFAFRLVTAKADFGDFSGAGLSGRGVRRRHPMVAGSVKNAVGNYLYWMRLGREMPVYPKLPKRIMPVDPFHRK